MAFLVFEGGEGTGKSTQIQLLASWLRSLGVPCLLTREPGGTPLAEDVRSLFKAVPVHGDSPTTLTELMLVMAARAQHVERVVRPALASGTWVLCDRFLDSTYVYQGVRGGLEKAYIDAVAAPVVSGLLPELTFVFSVDVEVARQRLLRRSAGTGEPDRLDGLDDEAHRQIDAGFVSLVRQGISWPDGRVPKRVLVDSAQSVSTIEQSLRARVAELSALPEGARRS